MVYRIFRLPGEPIIVASLAGVIDPDVFENIYQKSAELLGQFDGPSCHILDCTDFMPEPDGNAASLAERIQKGMSRFQSASSLFCVLVGTQQRVLDAAEALSGQNITMPVFSDLNAAYSYLNLKVSGLDLQQSMKARDTDAFGDTIRVAPLSNSFANSLQATGTVEFPSHGVLFLKAIGMNRSQLVFPEKGVTLGRREANRDKPDIDLSLWGAHRYGVSRRHARIVSTDDNRLHLFDLNSTNGTFVNSKRVKPDEAFVLHDGDEILLGRLGMCIYFQHLHPADDEPGSASQKNNDAGAAEAKPGNAGQKNNDAGAAEAKPGNAGQEKNGAEG